ncbi:hypothetical protein LTR48_009507, partial [Friedmanniomyces endolithicus]
SLRPGLGSQGSTSKVAAASLSSSGGGFVAAEARGAAEERLFDEGLAEAAGALDEALAALGGSRAVLGLLSRGFEFVFLVCQFALEL